MKKTVFFLFIFFIGLVNVSAKTYYSDYEEYTKEQDEIVEASDTMRIEEVKVYQAYKKSFEYEYLEENNLYESTGNYIKNVREWIKNKDDLSNEMPYEEGTAYTYRPYIGYKYYYIKNLSNTKVAFDNIRIYNKKTNETIYKIDKMIYEVNDIFCLNIENKVSILNLEVELDIPNELLNNIKLEFGIMEQVMFNSPKMITGTLTTNKKDNHIKVKTDNYSDAFANTFYILINETNDDDLLSGTMTVYRNYEIKYEYKIPIIEYQDLFLEEANEEYEIDKEKYKYIYKYKKRDKFELNDELIITDKETKLTDFILYSTTDDIKITSNINYGINGKYKVNFILPFKTISKDIIVDIKENYINTIKYQDNLIQSLNEKVDRANYQVDKKNLETKSILEEKVELEKEINDQDKYIKNLEEEKTDIKETKVKKQSLNLIYLLILITILYIIDVVYEKKKEKR